MPTTRFRILGCGTALPRRQLDNQTLAAELHVTPEWIEGRCGIRQRAVAADDETTGSLAVLAARAALQQARGLQPDLLLSKGNVLATSSSETGRTGLVSLAADRPRRRPPTACRPW
jgi:3-oxoacyl-[acyl-carrier-protein] synthase-3